jgi:hypothetical protein
LTSVLVTLGILELGVRILMPQHPEFWDYRKFLRASPDPPHLWENIPHGRNDYFIGVPVSINSNGLRGEEVQIPKPPDTFRILGVGDSITFGYGIRLEDTFLKVLERRLNETATGGLHYETLNAGAGATGLDYYHHFITTNGPVLQPDLVLIGLCLNDIEVYRESDKPSDAGEAGEPSGLPRRISDFLLEHSQLYMASYMRLKSTLYGLGILDINKILGYNFLALEPPSPEQAEAWSSALQFLSRIAAFCNQHHYPLVVVVFPMEMQLSPAALRLYRDRLHVRLGSEAVSGEPQRRIEEFGAANGVTVMDLLPAFRAVGAGKLFLRNISISHDPVHPSPLGNGVAGEEIFRALRAQHLLPVTESAGQ